MSTRTPKRGISSNGMAYARWGTEGENILMIPGGPGNNIPRGGALRLLLRPFDGLVDAGYSLWYVARKHNMPDGYTIEDMAGDYAELIETQFGGTVDVVLGTSYGGLVAQYLAANHPGCFDRIVVAVAACEMSEWGKESNRAFAEHMAAGRSDRAGAILIETAFPRLRLPWLSKLGGRVLGPLAAGDHESYRRDVLTEAEAAIVFDSRAVLPGIEVPVLLLAGDEDRTFPIELATETARLIPDCTLKVYKGKNHFGAFVDKRLARDVLAVAGR